MARAITVECCMNKASVVAARAFWISQGYIESFSISNGDDYQANERDGPLGDAVELLGNNVAGAEKIWVLVFRQDT